MFISPFSFVLLYLLIYLEMNYLSIYSFILMNSITGHISSPTEERAVDHYDIKDTTV